MAPERLQLNSFAPGMPPDPRAAWTELQREEPLPVVITEVEATAAAVEPDIEVHDGIARLAAAAAPPVSGEGRKRRGGSASAA